jgi:hypothetical protein
VHVHVVALLWFESKAESLSCAKQCGETKDCEDSGGDGMDQPNRHPVSDLIA